MGKSAKLHKRSARKATSSQPTTSLSKPIAMPQPHTIASGPGSNRKKNLKTKLNNNMKTKAVTNGTNGENVLGDVDYVALMMGGRKKAQAEANKMTVD